MKLFFSRFKYIIIALIILAIAASGGIFVYSQKKSVVIKPGEAVIASPTPTPAFDLTTWKDDAGFSIQYPKELRTNRHEEDNDNYAHLELTTSDHPGKIIVWVSDLPKGVTTLDSWVKKSFTGATSLDTTLGGEPAKKILTSAPYKMLTVGAISDNLLFSVEGTLTDSEYWTRVHDEITGSFAFTQDAPSSAAPSTGGGGDIDEEEVVQ